MCFCVCTWSIKNCCAHWYMLTHIDLHVYRPIPNQLGSVPGPPAAAAMTQFLAASLHTPPCPSLMLQKKRAISSVRGMIRCSRTHSLRPEKCACKSSRKTDRSLCPGFKMSRKARCKHGRPHDWLRGPFPLINQLWHQKTFVTFWMHFFLCSLVKV